MPWADEQIEQIVRQVLASLPGEPADGPPVDPADNSATIHHAVITADRIRRQPAAVRRLVVPAGAVITPAARDLLHERQIEWTTRQSLETNATKNDLVIGCGATKFKMDGLLRLLRKNGLSSQVADAGDLVALISQLADELAEQPRLAVVLTDAPAVAVCLANRRTGVRAAEARDIEEIHERVTELGLNLLIVRPHGRNLYEMVRMVQAFTGAGPRGCPERYQAALK